MDTRGLLEDFLHIMQTRYPIDGANMPMSEWIEKNTHMAGRPFSFDGYEFQREIADDMHPDLACIKCSQVGLALALDTPVPTPAGWSTMGDLQVGDQVFDEQGAPCVVEYVSPIYIDHDCYQITFDDGEKIVADANHRWFVQCDRPFNHEGVYRGLRGRPHANLNLAHDGVLRTEQIFKHYKAGSRNIFAIPNTKPLECEPADLPVEPYYLGLWLGDGNLHASVITAHEDDADFYKAELTSRRMVCYPSSVRGRSVQFRVNLPDHRSPPYDSVSKRLKSLGLLGQNKFVPEMYLRASRAQRLDLLRGLIDTDGTVTKKGLVSFYNTSPHLVEAVQELARSLGYKTRTRWRAASPSTLANGHLINSQRDIAEVRFMAYAEEPVCLLPRKRSRLFPRLKGRSTESLRRRIVSVRKVETVPVRCISVNSPSHLFLAGRGMIPTHNTETQIRKFLGWLTRNRGRTGIFTLPSEKLFKRISKMRIKPLIESEAVFNMRIHGDAKPTRSMDMYQIAESFAIISGLTEDDATSTSADILFHDELDLSDQEMINLAQSRLQNSDFKITQRFSTPKWPGFGIDGLWQVSDQHEYFFKCGSCNHMQIPAFDMNFMCLPGYTGPEIVQEATDDELNAIDFGEAHVKCERCSKPLDLRDPSRRFWVAKHPGRLIRGYRVRPFSTHRITLRYIFGRLLASRRSHGVAGFYNTVLGEPYVDSKAQLSETEVRSILRSPAEQDVSDDLPVFLGIDVGDVCHIVGGPIINGYATTAFIRTVPAGKLGEALDSIMRRYNVVGGLMDRHPYTPTANEIRDRFHNRILPVEYRGQAAVSMVRDELENLSHAQVNRTQVLDDVVTAVRSGRLELNGYGALDSVLIEHLRNMVREEEPEQPAKWVKLSTEDHFFHALAFFLAAPRVHELAFHFVSSSLLTSVGLFDLDEFTDPLSAPTVKEPAPLSTRARMKAALWL